MKTIIQALGSMLPDGRFDVISKSGKHYPATLSKDLTSDDLTDCDKVELTWYRGSPYIVGGIEKPFSTDMSLEEMQEEYNLLGGLY